MPVEIRQVWRSNLQKEFVRISWALHRGYRVVSLDTEFPGAPLVPFGVSLNYRDRSCDDHYATLKINVDRMKIIQAGLTLTDQFGNLPHFGTGKRIVWEFNFSDFDSSKDECSKESVKLLESHGIDFDRHRNLGIKSAQFARYMVWSGLIGHSEAWITFQGGVDLAYFLKMLLNNSALPNDLQQFKACIGYFFGPCVFDVKHMMTRCNLYGGLDKVATNLKVERDAGESHRAGSDSLLTTMVFQKLRQVYFSEPQELHTFVGKLHNFV
ncbi:unnamed protein product [Rhodiola kirilowii]